MKQRRARGCLAVLIALAVLVGGAAFLAVESREWLQATFTTPDYNGDGSGAVEVEVKDGESAVDIALTLEEQDVVKSAEAFVSAAKRDSRSRLIQPGFYEMKAQMSGAAALRLMLDPSSRIEDYVTVPEGQRISWTVRTLAGGTDIKKGDFEAFVDEPKDLELPSYAKNRPEGFLFPAKYPVNPGTTADDLLRRMVERYDEEADRLNLEKRAKRIGRSPREIVTVASIIEGEVNRPNDFGKVARVIYNRLDEDWRLDMDSTVLYANDSGDRRVSPTAKELRIDSPYNTRKYKGLPPGPIGSPGGKALEAALDPTPGDWMFFVSVNPDTGETKFAETDVGHQENVDEYQAWCAKHKGRC